MKPNKKPFKKVYIEITNCCNLNCSFCPETKRAKQFMQVEEFEKIVKQVKDVTNLITFHVKGEPLLHPKLKELLYIAKENGLAVNITTNATLLKEKEEILLTSPAIRQLNLSLHSREQNEKEVHSYLEDVYEVVSKIRKHTNMYISYRLWNLKSLEENRQNKEVLDFLEDGYNMKGLLKRAQSEEFIQLAEKVFLNQDYQFNWPDRNGPILSCSGTCQGLRSQIAILVNGDVVPCCLDQEGDIVLGNLLQEPLNCILQSERAQRLRKGLERRELVEELCKRCEYRERFA